MSEPLPLPVDAIRERLNVDPEFTLTARYWNCDIRYRVGDDDYFMHIENGRVTTFVAGTQGYDPYDIHVGGALETWRPMLLEANPKPFYHDIFAATLHHGFEMSGDLGAAYAYYYALRRIHAVFGECVRAAARAA
ncbi:MAG: hypothetical protein AB7Q81_15720 [Gammaproteobacteria bacterium]